MCVLWGCVCFGLCFGLWKGGVVRPAQEGGGICSQQDCNNKLPFAFVGRWCKLNPVNLTHPQRVCVYVAMCVLCHR